MRRATGASQVFGVPKIPFQSTLSMRRATTSTPRFTLRVIFQSTLSMRRATKTFAAKRYGIKISIHALHEESDLQVFQHRAGGRRISIHALHEESDSPRTLKRYGSTYISIHALHEESDFTIPLTVGRTEQFQSTLSMRRATRLPTNGQCPQ